MIRRRSKRESIYLSEEENVGTLRVNVSTLRSLSTSTNVNVTKKAIVSEIQTASTRRPKILGRFQFFILIFIFQNHALVQHHMQLREKSYLTQVIPIRSIRCFLPFTEVVSDQFLHQCLKQRITIIRKKPYLCLFDQSLSTIIFPNVINRTLLEQLSGDQRPGQGPQNDPCCFASR